MLLNTINAEWIKLRSTKGVYWTSALVLLLSVGLSAFIGWANGLAVQSAIDDKDTSFLADLGDMFTFSGGQAGLLSFGSMVIMIQAVLIVTGDYGNSTVKLSVLSAPRRWQLAVAKFIVYGIISAVLAVVAAVVSAVLTHALAAGQLDDSSMADGLALSADDAWKTIGLIVVYVLGAVALCIGVGFLVRRTAGAMAIVLLWVLVLEDLTTLIPHTVGKFITPYMPFKNISSAISGSDLEDAPWGQGGSLIYFVVVCVVIFAAGVVALRRRDA
jgi:ABC-2 type transport system permease protein